MLLCSLGVALAQTVLSGTVKDSEGPLIGASVKVLKGSDVARGAITDFDGNFRISMDPGTYDVEISYTGYQTQKITGVQVLVNKLNNIPDVTILPVARRSPPKRSGTCQPVASMLSLLPRRVLLRLMVVK